MIGVNPDSDIDAELNLPMLLDELGYAEGEFVSICHKVGEGQFTTAVVAPGDAAETVADLPAGADMWFGVNPVAGPARSRAGRGTADDVTRLAALIGDLDVDPAYKCPDFPTAHAIIDELSEIVGSRPVVITESGHGLQPYWPLSDDDAGQLVEHAEAKNLLSRFGVLVKTVAAHHGCTADSVFDLARVLRVPGTVNHKDPADPVTVITRRDAGKPLTVEQIRVALAEFGIPEQPSTSTSTDLPQYSRQCLTTRVRKANKGFRNTILYGAAKDAARQGDLDDDLIAKLTAAALAVGLDASEINATITSAKAGVGAVAPAGPPEDGAVLLDHLVAWFARFVGVPDPADYRLLALWTVSTHMAAELYTTARLLIDSIMPESGKTTLIEHLAHLCWQPVQAASVGSPAVLVRLVRSGPRTLLIDEADRVLDPNKPGVGELLAVLNSGYKRGAKRPVSVPDGHGGWTVEEMPTFAPVAMAGNNPHLPDDTRSRTIRILLMPDFNGTVEDSEWEIIEASATVLHDRIMRFADQHRGSVARAVDLPAGCVSRAREKWKPLKRVAVAAGRNWPAITDALIVRGLQEDAEEREAGLRGAPPGMVLLQDLYTIWPADAGEDELVPTTELVAQLIRRHPDHWGAASAYGKALTEHRLGRIVRQAAKLSSTRPGGRGPRGFTKAQFNRVWRSLGIDGTPTYASGASGESGAISAPHGSGPEPVAPLHALAPDSPVEGERTDTGPRPRPDDGKPANNAEAGR
ncbi:MAG: DUF3631 domain-containing protein [Mycobacterium sp.]|nr:MAG: DUF3631 domain-containing protein [Mycobacterium sp.]